MKISECIDSAAEALERAHIEFTKKDDKLYVNPEDRQKAESVVAKEASDEGDIKFLETKTKPWEVSEDVEITLNGERYLLEKGDQIAII